MDRGDLRIGQPQTKLKPLQIHILQINSINSPVIIVLYPHKEPYSAPTDQPLLPGNNKEVRENLV